MRPCGFVVRVDVVDRTGLGLPEPGHEEAARKGRLEPGRPFHTHVRMGMRSGG